MAKCKKRSFKTLFSVCILFVCTFFTHANGLAIEDIHLKNGHSKKIGYALSLGDIPLHYPNTFKPPLPSATISGTTTVCQNDTEPQITFTGSAGTAPYTFTYNINGGANQTVTSTGDIALVNVSTIIDGTFSYNLVSVEDGIGDTQIISGSATITIEPLPTASADGTQTICSNSSATVSGASAANGTILWTHDGAGSISNATTLTPTYTPTAADEGNTVILTITVTSNNACNPQTANANYSIVVEALPTASASGTQTICSNSSATVSGASAANGTILWTHNGSGAITDETTLSPTYTPTAADEGNTVILTITVTSNNACNPQTANANYSIVVEALPTASAGGTQTICSNSSATVSGASAANGTILWTHNGSGAITDETTLSPTYTPTAADEGNTVILTITVTSNNACNPQTANANYSIVVEALPTASAGGTQTICSNSSATVSGASAANGTILWTHDGDGSISNATTLTPTYTPTAADEGNTVILTITVTSNNACNPQTANANYSIVVEALPTASAGGTQTICPDDMATVSGASAANGTILWTHDGSGSISGSTTLTPTYTADMSDAGSTVTLTMTVTSNNTCNPETASDIYAINIYDLPTVDNPGEQTYCQLETTSAILLTGLPSGVVFDISGGSSIGIADATDVTEIPSFLAITAGSATLSITPKANGCTGTPINVVYNITEIPLPQTNPSTRTICSGGSTNIILGSTTTGTTFTWVVTSADAGIIGASDDTGNHIDQVLENNSGTTGTVTYQITAQANSCAGGSIPLTITVHPKVTVVIDNPATVCSPSTVDLTDPTITSGSSSGINYTYWTDASATNQHTNPTTATAGTYYIKGTDPATSCYDIQPVVVNVSSTPTVVITNPASVCSPATVDLTASAITAGSTPGLTYTFWTDPTATTSYSTPTTAGDDTYYIKGETPDGCFDIQAVTATVLTTLGTPVFSAGTSSTACKGDSPETYSATASNATSLIYSLDAISLAGGNTINSSTGEVTFDPNYTGSMTITATANGCGAPVQAIHTITIFDPPTVSLSTSDTELCGAGDFTLTSTSSGGSTLEEYSGSSGIINMTIPDYNNSSYSYPSINISGSGGATLSPSDIVIVTINLTITRDRDLDFFLVDPTGTRAMLLSSDNGSWGDDYTNTVFRTDASTPISSGSSPFNGTYLPEGSITTAPDRSGARGGLTYNSVIPANSLDGATIDGNWTLRIFDDESDRTANLINWSLEINKIIGSGFTTVFNGPGTIGPVTYSGSNNSTATVNVSAPIGTHSYTATTTDANGCSTTSTPVTVTVHDSPNASISADYCTAAPKIRLTTTAGFASYDWEPLPLGETDGNNYIDIEIAGIYSVSVTDANGCTGTASINVSNEYVTNGSFTLGNTGFTTPATGGNQYTYVTNNPSENDELWPEGLYGIGNDANDYHGNFWGFDHTDGSGSFMIVNGFPGAPQPTVWEQVITGLQPNTTYYFSAWAISLNSAGNDAQLRFSINGSQLGTIADLTTIPGVSNNSNSWQPEGRFYGTWNSGASTSATLSIVDLQTAPGGNDFGLDDISFGILDPSPAEIDSITVNEEVCSGDNIEFNSYISGGKEPITYLWTGPNGFSSTDANPIITPVDPSYPGTGSHTYTLTVGDWYGCSIDPKSVTLTMYAQPTSDAGENQTVCSDSPEITLNGTIGGAASSSTWSSNGTGTFNNPSSLTSIYTPSANDIANGGVTLSLTTDDPTGPCSETVSTMILTINPSPVIAIDITIPSCTGNSNGQATANVTSGTSPFTYLWSDGQTTQTAINLNDGTYSVTVTDALGCTVTSADFDIVEPELLLIQNPSYISTPPSCYGGSDGTATIQVDGGTPPYKFNWLDAPGSQTTQTATGLSDGIYWFTVTDANDCNMQTGFAVVIEPGDTELTCPLPPTPVQTAPLATSADVNLTDPIYDPSCQSITWTMNGANVVSTPTAGFVPSPYNFNVGTTTIEYTVTNTASETQTCTYDVVVLPNDPPDISCVDPATNNTNTDVCTADLSIGLPTVNTGDNISWSWEMTGATIATGAGSIPDPYTFNVDTTYIEWTATNISGTDVCTQMIIVIDNQLPTFTVPAPLEECVELINQAIFYAPTTDINPDRPEYFTFTSGSTELDLNPLNFADNCDLSCGTEIRWRIDFDDGTALPSTDPTTFEIGQPSSYGSDIQFLGDGVTFANVTHTITFWIVDCHGNVSNPQQTTLTVTPRPRITKQN